MHWRRKWQPTPVFLPGESQGRGAWWAAVYGVTLLITILGAVIIGLILRIKRGKLQRQNKDAAAAAKSLQSCPTLCPGLPRPWDSLGKNTGVGCHCLLQCMKVRSESEVTQSCPTLRDPMDCTLPASSIHGVFQARVLEWGAIAFSGYTLYLTIMFWTLFYLLGLSAD